MSSKYKALNDASRLAYVELNGEEPKPMEDKLIKEVCPAMAIIKIAEVFTKIVKESPGISGVDLIVSVCKESPELVEKVEVEEIFDALVKDGELIEFLHLPPDGSKRYKTMYFIKGTEFGFQY